MTRRPRRLIPLLLALGLGGTSCVDDLGQGPKEEPVALALSASVTGLSAAGSYTVNVQVSYQISGGGSRPLQVEPSSFQIAGGDPPASKTIAIVLAPCLEDPDRVEAESGGCRLSVTLGLSDETGELAQISEDLGLVMQGQQIERPIALTPNYLLTIAGGGPGTGSGTVTIPSAAAQPVLSCQITDGQASAAGCTGRYPLHTAVMLTASTGTLASWAGDCGGIAADSPCQLAMDGHRAVAASFATVPTTGELEVQIAGLPAGIAAQVTVANLGGFSQTVTETSTLSGLAPGDYTVTASPVLVPPEGRTYSPAPPQQTVSVMAGARATVQIAYLPPETGSLEVSITGLPEGTGALVTVTGPNDFSQLLTATSVLNELRPGDYTVTASPVLVPAEGLTYTPSPPQKSVNVAGGERATVEIGYNPPETGSLAVAITGLPGGTGAIVTVAGPNNFSQPLTMGQTLSGLLPGRYTVTAQDVETSDQIYAPAPPSQTKTVSPKQTAEATVAYAATRVSLTVNVSGLPGGVDAIVTVTGPNEYQQGLTGSTVPPLVKLTPGNYSVSASSVTTSTEQVYDPTVAPRQRIPLKAGESATVTVTYALPAATKLVFVQQPATTLIGAVITPPVTVEVRDAQDRPVPGYVPDVTLTLQDDPEQDPSGATLGGLTSVPPQNGVASFGDLTVDRARSGYTLVASSGTLSPATSDAFTVTSGTPVITAVSFPSTVSNGPGIVVQANVSFSDPGRDITQLLVTEVSDPDNAYSPHGFQVSAPDEGPDVLDIDLWECSASRGCPTGDVTLDLTLRDVDGNTSLPARVLFSVVGSTPVITKVTFPKVIPGEAKTFTYGTIDFVDADGDVVLLDGEVIQCIGAKKCGWTDYDPHVSGQTEGSVSFNYGCGGPGTCYGIRVTLQFVLVDFAGNRSEPVNLSFQFDDQPITSPPSGGTSRRGSTDGQPGQRLER